MKKVLIADETTVLLTKLVYYNSFYSFCQVLSCIKCKNSDFLYVCIYLVFILSLRKTVQRVVQRSIKSQ